jgi:hypothetical protein
MNHPFCIAHAVQVAGCRADHDRQLADRGHDRFLAVASLDQCESQLDRCGIGQVPETRFTREQLPLGTIRLAYKRFLYFGLPQFYPDRLVALPADLDVRLDNPLFIHYFL